MYAEGWRPNNRIEGFSLAQDILLLSLHTPEETDNFTTSALDGFAFRL